MKKHFNDIYFLDESYIVLFFSRLKIVMKQNNLRIFFEKNRKDIPIAVCFYVEWIIILLEILLKNPSREFLSWLIPRQGDMKFRSVEISYDWLRYKRRKRHTSSRIARTLMAAVFHDFVFTAQDLHDRRREENGRWTFSWHAMRNTRNTTRYRFYCSYKIWWNCLMNFSCCVPFHCVSVE